MSRTKLKVVAVAGGLQGVRLGEGPPLLVMPPFSPVSQLPTGTKLALTLKWLSPLAERFTVHYVSRPQGLTRGQTSRDLAAPYAEFLASSFDEPVPVLGCSSGGVFALQLAADAPALVSRLVLLSSAHRLGPVGHDVCAAFIERAEAGRFRSAAAVMQDAIAEAAAARAAMRAASWAFASMYGMGRGYDPTDAIVTLEAEMGFAAHAHLRDVRAPVLLMCGDRDLYYPREVVEECARLLPQARTDFIAGGHAAPILRQRYAPYVMDFLAQQDERARP